MSQDIKYIIVEDQEIISTGLTMALAEFSDLSLLGLAKDGEKGIEMALSLKPDMIIMDLGLPRLDGIEATRRICKASPDIKILINSSREGPRDVFASFAAGAWGYIRKANSGAEIHKAMQEVMDGQFTIDPQIAGHILAYCCELQWSTTLTGVDGTPFVFSERELAVVGLLAQGLNNNSMAEKLGLDLDGLNREKKLLRESMASLGSRLSA
jgi:two-component system, NarL family, response regulator LiaR